MNTGPDALFVKYQVPSDMLSYDGEAGDNSSPDEKVERVKIHLEAVMDLAHTTKDERRDKESGNIESSLSSSE